MTDQDRCCSWISLVLSLCLQAGCVSAADRRADETPPRRAATQTPRQVVQVRFSGTGRLPELPERFRASHRGVLVEAVYEVCLDLASATSRYVRPPPGQRQPVKVPGVHPSAIRPLPGLQDPEADALVIAALRDWEWWELLGGSRSPGAGGGPVPLCWAQTLRFPVAGQGRVTTAPQENTGFTKTKVAGDLPHLPEFVWAEHPGDAVETVYEICLDRDTGTLLRVKRLTGPSDVDEYVATQLRTWSWEISAPAAMGPTVCFADNFRFEHPGPVDEVQAWVSKVTDAADARYVLLAPSVSIRRESDEVARKRPTNVPAFVIKKDKLAGADPHLPDWFKAGYRGHTFRAVYKLCLAEDGSVDSVSTLVPVIGVNRSVLATLNGWRYRPQAVPVCYIETFVWVIGE